MDLTFNEIELIKILRDLKPFEKIEISKDKQGKPDTIFVHRSQKIIFDKEIMHIKECIV